MTMATARDAMFDLFNTAWLADPTAATVPLLFDDVDGDEPGADSDGNAQPFARVTVQHTETGSETLGGPTVGRELAEGFFVVQIFTPKGRGNTQGDQLADIAYGILRRARFGDSDINSGWFFNASPREVPNPGAHAQINVTAEFRYGRAA